MAFHLSNTSNRFSYSLVICFIHILDEVQSGNTSDNLPEYISPLLILNFTSSFSRSLKKSKAVAMVILGPCLFFLFHSSMIFTVSGCGSVTPLPDGINILLEAAYFFSCSYDCSNLVKSRPALYPSGIQ